jgi:hypothetical protein
MLKKCNKCLIEKDVSLFSGRSKSKDGLQNQCKSCKSNYAKNFRIKHPEKYKSYHKKKVYNREYQFMYKHGFPREEALLILKEQVSCPVCNELLDDEKGNWCIDHDHNCCKPLTSCSKCRRDILCRNCNVMLGLAKDNEQILENAVKYIRKHKEKIDGNLQRSGNERKE